MSNGGPLEGLRVVELGTMASAPFCSKILADASAEVVKIEEPVKGDPARSYGPFPNDIPHPEKSGLFLYLNTSKLGITLNIKKATGREIFLQLLSQAEVFVENTPPGLLPELELDYEALKDRYPQLVYASISPFGRTGPYANYKAYDINSAALGGTSEQLGRLGREPLQIPFHNGGYKTGLAAASAVVTALLVRGRTGKGQAIDMAEADVWATNQTGSHFLSYQASGEVSSRVAERPQQFPGTFVACKDGYMALGLSQRIQWLNLLQVVGKPEWAEDPKYRERGNLSEEAVQELEAVIKPWFLAHTKEEAFQLFRAKEVPVTPIMTAADLVNSPQEVARGFFTQVDREQSGPLRYPGAPYQMSQTPVHIRRPAPLLGEHNEEVYCNRLAYSTEDLAAFRRDGII